MQEQLEALEQEIANAMKKVKAARESILDVSDPSAKARLRENLRHCEGNLEGLRTALEIMMLVGRQ